MIIYPAIDLLGGKCVRLQQGDYQKVTVYSDDPVAMAEDFARQGATWIHIVDLDGAKSGDGINRPIISAIAKLGILKVQTGGGIRNMDSLQSLIEDSQVSRCVIGTAAIRDQKFLAQALATYGDKIAVGLDARKGELALDGWTQNSGVKAIDFAKELEAMGATTVIYTDIDRDGMLTGPAVSQTAALVQGTKLAVIASGGIGSEEDVTKIATTGCAGVIIGKGIYEGKVRLAACLQNE